MSKTVQESTIHKHRHTYTRTIKKTESHTYMGQTDWLTDRQWQRAEAISHQDTIFYIQIIYVKVGPRINDSQTQTDIHKNNQIDRITHIHGTEKLTDRQWQRADAISHQNIIFCIQMNHVKSFKQAEQTDRHEDLLVAQTMTRTYKLIMKPTNNDQQTDRQRDSQAGRQTDRQTLTEGRGNFPSRYHLLHSNSLCPSRSKKQRFTNTDRHT